MVRRTVAGLRGNRIRGEGVTLGLRNGETASVLRVQTVERLTSQWTSGC